MIFVPFTSLVIRGTEGMRLAKVTEENSAL